VIIDIHTAIPLGLIVNEIASNFCASYGKGEADDKFLEITLEESSELNYTITCRDQANVFNEAFKSSFAFELIDTLIDQLDGYMECSGENELVYQINFSVDSI